jgi:hypothetical protein
MWAVSMMAILKMKTVPQVAKEGFGKFKSTHATTKANQEETGCFGNPPLGQ